MTSREGGRIPSDSLLLIIVASIENYTIFGLPLDDGSSCIFLYIEKLVKLGLHQQYLDMCDDISLLAFHDSITHPYGATDLPLSLGEGEDEMKVILPFLIVHSKSSFNDILGISLL